MTVKSAGYFNPNDYSAAETLRWTVLRAVIVRNLTLKFFSEIAGRALQFAFIVVAARRLGPADFGIYSHAVALGFVLAQTCDLGLQLNVARELARAPGRSTQIMGASLWSKLTLFVPSLGFLWAYVWLQPPIARGEIIFTLALSVMLTSHIEFFNYTFRGYQRLEFEAGLNLTSRLLGPGTAIFALLFGAPLRFVGWNLLLANLLTVGLGYYWLTCFFTVPDWAAGYAGWWQTMRRMLPLGLAILASALYTRIGVLLLNQLASPAEAGLINAAQRLTEPLQIVPAILLAAIFPAFAGEDSSWHRRAIARHTIRSLFILGAILALGGWFGADLIVAVLYGPAFRPSASALPWLALALLPMFLNYALMHFIIARGRPWLNALFTSIVLFECMLLNLWLIPIRGVVGAALSLLISEVTLLALSALGFFRIMRPSL